MKRVLGGVVVVLVVLELGCVMAVAVAVVRSTGVNHTGLPLGGFVRFGVAGLLAGAGALWAGQARVRRSAAAALCLVSALLALGVLALERTGSLLEYDRWAQQGLPSP